MNSTFTLATTALELARCSRCGHHDFPASVYGCGHCGAEAAAQQPVPLPGTPRLLNFVTLHAALAPGLPVPCVIGEVQLAPDLVEEALIDVPSEADLHFGMALQPVAVPWEGTAGWRFVPAESAP